MSHDFTAANMTNNYLQALRNNFIIEEKEDSIDTKDENLYSDILIKQNHEERIL